MESRRGENQYCACQNTQVNHILTTPQTTVMWIPNTCTKLNKSEEIEFLLYLNMKSPRFSFSVYHACVPEFWNR